MTFGEKLRATRKEKGFEAQYVAKKLNVAKSTYSGYENDKTKPSFEILQEITKLLDVSTDYLLGITNTTNLTNSAKGLSQKDEKDIAKELEKLKENLESQEGLMFSGDALDDDTRELLLASLERTLRQSKALAKEKFTPKKFK